MTTGFSFRHLDYGESSTIEDVGLAGLQALLDDGDVADWRPVLRAVRADPWGLVAGRVERLLGHLASYGTAEVLRIWLERCRGGVTAPALRLAQLRERTGLTQRDLAARMGVSQAQIARLESSSNPTLRSLRRYLGALDLDIAALVAVGRDAPAAILLPEDR